MRLFDPKTYCHLFVDALSHGVRCVVKQDDENGILHSVAYHSGNLHGYEKKLCNYRIIMFGNCGF